MLPDEIVEKILGCCTPDWLDPPTSIFAVCRRFAALVPDDFYEVRSRLCGARADCSSVFAFADPSASTVTRTGTTPSILSRYKTVSIGSPAMRRR